MTTVAFKNVFDQVGFCGIWCGSCAVGTSALMEMADRYCQLCETHGLGHWGAGDFDYQAYLKGLASISELPVCHGCLKDGGRTDCELRTCARGRGLRACSYCPDIDECLHAVLLEHMRSGARAAQLVVLESPQDHDLSAEKKYSELETLWWWRAMFSTDE